MPGSTDRGHRVDALVEAIRSAITAGTLGPGQRINQDEWAERMNLSRTPVRLALERLEAEGFIRLLPRRGAVVVQVTPESLEDILTARLILEPSLGRAGAGNLTPADAVSLRRANDEIQAIELPKGHRDLFAPAHRFHHTLYLAAGTPMIYRYAAQAADHSHVFLNRQWYANRRIAQVTKLYYADLLISCVEGDLTRVESVMREHRVNLAGVILQESVQVSDLRVLPKLLSAAEMARLSALVDGGEEPTWPVPVPAGPRP